MSSHGSTAVLHRFFAPIAIILALFVSSPAMAQSEPTFKDLIGDAKTAFEAEEYQKAIDLLLYAHRIQPNPRLLINVAKSYEKMDECAPAVVYYKAYLRESETEDQLVDAAEGAVDDAADCDGYDQAMSGRLIIESTPRGAAIKVDGKEVGVTPFEVPGLASGAHTVTLELEGYETFESNVSLSPDADTNVSASLTEEQEEVVVADPDPDPEPDPVVTKKDDGVGPMVYVAGGIATVGVGLLILGVVQDLVVIPGIDDERDGFAVDSEDYQRLTDDRSSAATLALVGYIGGSLLALGGGGWLVYQLFFDEPKESPTVDIGNGVDIRPVVRHDGGGVILEGRF